jgi:hypothetical protein
MDPPPPIKPTDRRAGHIQQAGRRRIGNAFLKPRYSGLALVFR